MNEPNLSSFIWSFADLLRGDYRQSEYGKVILPFTVLRRLDCVLEPTKANVLAELANPSRHKPASEAAKIDSLTKRERQIISLVAQGLRNKQIAARLFISEITVRHHLTSVFSKLDAADRFELILFALKHGLSDTPA